MRVVHCGPAGGTFDAFEALMRGQDLMYNFVTCQGRAVPEGLAGLFLDSGAFQAWKRGTSIDPEALAAWYDRHDTALAKMALDVIGGSEEAQGANLRLMESLGQNVVPVFHGPHCESWRWFDGLCERYPLVAIGSVLPDNTSSDATEWLAQVFDRICDSDSGIPRVAIHGLRLASRVRDFPFASVDSSTWIRASKNGRGPTAGGGQTDKPWRTCAELQEEWIRFYAWVPKCERWVPRRSRVTRVEIVRPDTGQLTFLSEAL